MTYAMLMLWNDRWKFLPAVLAVAVSAVLVSMQFGLLAGTLSFTSQVIDHAAADIWIGVKDVPSVDAAMPVPESWLPRFGGLDAIVRSEQLFYGFAACTLETGGTSICCVVGSRLDQDAIGRVDGLHPDLAARLAEPDTVIVDAGERDSLGLTVGVGELMTITNHRVRVVGLTQGYKSIGAPFVFCSQSTARRLLPMFAGARGNVSFWLLKCDDPTRVAAVVDRLRGTYDDMSAASRQDFSRSTRQYWLTRSMAGLAMGFTAFLALLVSLVITSQILYSATLASMKEFATLRALGIGWWRLGQLVLYQAFCVGVLGIALAIPIDLALSYGVSLIGGNVLLTGWLLPATAAVTMATAMQAGFWALRSLRHAEPIALLR
jgi:putative ABC transport system permease protein